MPKKPEPYQLKTAKGYDFFEASSTFQKAIRRGDEELAMFFMVEFYNSKMSEYIWKRMLIMSAEDVGMANPSLHGSIRLLKESFDYLVTKNDKKGSERLFLSQAVLMLVRSPKSRLVDWALNHYWDAHHRANPPIPDYALDIHTRKGKMLGKTINDFFDVGSICENWHEQDNEITYRDWCRKMWNALRGQNMKGEKDETIDIREIRIMMGKDPITGKPMADTQQQDIFETSDKKPATDFGSQMMEQ